MDCAAIAIEVQTNNAKVQQLASDKGLKVAQNVAAGVAGLVIPVLWFGMDFQGTADTEIQALQARQQYLAALAEQRRCGEDTGAPQKVVTEASKKSKAKPKAAVSPDAAGVPPQVSNNSTPRPPAHCYCDAIGMGGVSRRHFSHATAHTGPYPVVRSAA